MPSNLTPADKEAAFKGFLRMIKSREEFSDEYFLANWWMGKYVTSKEFDQLLERETMPNWFHEELMDHHSDWIEEMSEEAFQQYLDKQSNHVLFQHI